MRYFLDTEFIERGPKHPIELISIGLVAEDGREYYAISTEFKPHHASEWVKEHVLSHLPERNVTPHLIGTALFRVSQSWKSRSQIAADILTFVGRDSGPQFWGYYSDYDWVVFCQLFGDMSALPRGWPMHCRDLRQALDGMGFHQVVQPDDSEHDALQDARWIASTFLRMTGAQAA